MRNVGDLQLRAELWRPQERAQRYEHAADASHCQRGHDPLDAVLCEQPDARRLPNAGVDETRRDCDARIVEVGIRDRYVRRHDRLAIGIVAPTDAQQRGHGLRHPVAHDVTYCGCVLPACTRSTRRSTSTSVGARWNRSGITTRGEARARSTASVSTSARTSCRSRARSIITRHASKRGSYCSSTTASKSGAAPEAMMALIATSAGSLKNAARRPART